MVMPTALPLNEAHADNDQHHTEHHNDLAHYANVAGVRDQANGYAGLGASGRIALAAVPAHASTHDAGGSDALAVDSAAGTGSLRTLGTGATQAVQGNDSRITGKVVASSGLNVTVFPFTIGSYSYSGGTLALLPSGTWYVGVDLYTGNLHCLPRLGHRGWIPLACAVTGAASITDLVSMAPELPASRIPRTLKRISDGESIKVVVMGSSLLASDGGVTTWPGMVFGSSSSVDDYKIPATVTLVDVAVGGVPNQYQLAQLGFASGHTAYGYPSSGYPLSVTSKTPPNGRSALLSGVDLVVVGCLANGGDCCLECVEPIIRKLRSQGVEVVVVTDDAMGPPSTYSALAAASIYEDGPTVQRVCDLYGVELSDTAAYVAEAHVRYGSGIYADAIHMTSGAPAGPTATPANGHEVWARAVRSLFTVNSIGEDSTPSREVENRPLPPIRVVTDYKTPADTYVILPKDEYYRQINANGGTLGDHPWGTGSFQNVFGAGTTNALLTLPTGKSCVMGAHGVVGWSLIRYAAAADAAVTFDVYRSEAFQKTVSLGAAPFDNEWYVPVYTPTELGLATPTDPGDSIRIQVTSGTLKVAALIALTADLDYLFPEDIAYVGTWLPKEDSRSGLPGRPTDTAGSYAVVRCTGRRVQWLISGNPDSQPYDAWSDRDIVAGENATGNYHMFCRGGLLGPGANHVIKCTNTIAGSQANGRALHIGGAIVYNDR